MTFETIQIIQDYLTISNGNGERKKIINVKPLLNRHPPFSVIELLKNLHREKGKKLVRLIDLDKSKIEIDQTIGEMFRLYMAIKTLEREMEVKETCPS